MSTCVECVRNSRRYRWALQHNVQHAQSDLLWVQHSHHEVVPPTQQTEWADQEVSRIWPHMCWVRDMRPGFSSRDQREFSVAKRVTLWSQARTARTRSCEVVMPYDFSTKQQRFVCMRGQCPLRKRCVVKNHSSTVRDNDNTTVMNQELQHREKCIVRCLLLVPYFLVVEVVLEMSGKNAVHVYRTVQAKTLQTGTTPTRSKRHEHNRSRIRTTSVTLT